MSIERTALGAFGERIAAGHLRRAGYDIVATNVAVRPFGEIDIVARQQGMVVLVEVRTRRGDRYGGAAWSLTPTKQRRMLRAATAYLATLGDDHVSARIDVVLVNLDERGRFIGIEHIENALEG